jgi:hypothetical protein
MARLVVELNAFLKLLMGAGNVAEIQTGEAGNVVSDQGLGAIRPSPPELGRDLFAPGTD